MTIAWLELRHGTWVPTQEWAKRLVPIASFYSILVNGLLGPQGAAGGLLNSLLGGGSGSLLDGLLGGGGGETGGQNPLSIVNGLVKCLVVGLGVKDVNTLVPKLGIAAGVPIDYQGIINAVTAAAQAQVSASVGAGGSEGFHT
ncbi:hypothetical protein FHG87_025414 [Trinorchestia longiramus]|nr:hypothetical protein FHG87_025414 [Trinorchestia longiramus]